MLALIAAITHAITALLVKKISQTESIITLMFSMVLLMTPITLLPSLHFWTTPEDHKVYLLLILIAVIATLGNFVGRKH